MIGRHEPSQTKCFGFVLSQSVEAMKCFLELIYNKKRANQLANYKWIVQCETILKSQVNKKNGRADIIIGFYDGLTPKHIIIIEGKTIKNQTTASQAITQLLQYKDSILHQFKTKNLDIVTLTSYSCYDSSAKNSNCFANVYVYNITWSEIISGLIKHSDIRIINHFIKYLNNLNFMTTYDVEILCIPAGRTLPHIRKYGIYECPTIGRQYKRRGLMRPLYISFREGRNNGQFDILYKVKDVIAMDMNDKSAVASLKAKGSYPNIEQRINGYVNDLHPNGNKWVFILDLDESIKLPMPVQFSKAKGMMGHVILTLKDVISNPYPTVITLP